jgi:hypothetical protein
VIYSSLGSKALEVRSPHSASLTHVTSLLSYVRKFYSRSFFGDPTEYSVTFFVEAAGKGGYVYFWDLII